MRSRVLVGLLSVVLSSSMALADDAPAKAKPNVRVVEMLPETGQALLLDKATKKHLVVEVGTEVGAFSVASIEDDEVTLTDGAREMVLSAPAPRWHKRGDRKVATAKPVAANAVIDTKTDPYAEEAPVDPYADPQPRVVSATPIVAGQDGVRVARASEDKNPPAWADDTAPMTADDDAPDAPEAAPAPAAPPKPVVAPTVVMHSELNAALSDFGKLSAMVSGSFTAQGVRLDRVSDTSLFAHAGLRSGDMITAVDGKPLVSIDDAAELYARAGTTRAANIDIVRAGKPMTLRVLFN